MVDRLQNGRVYASMCTQCDGPLDKEMTIEVSGLTESGGMIHKGTFCSLECRDDWRGKRNG